MSEQDRKSAVAAADVPPVRTPTSYPEPYAARVAGREKRRLGNVFGLTNFGVNLTRLAPGAISSLRHAHARQDEFVYVLEGTATLVTERGESLLAPGMCAGFKAGNGDAHHLVNRTQADVVFLEIGDRSTGDSVEYPDEDLRAVQGPDGTWAFLHKDGSRY